MYNILLDDEIIFGSVSKKRAIHKFYRKLRWIARKKIIAKLELIEVYTDPDVGILDGRDLIMIFERVEK